MTRQERLVFCKKCQNRDFNLTKGILCNLTGVEAAFNGDCPDFVMDKQSNYIQEPKATIRPNATRAKNAELFIWVGLAVGFASFISSWMQYDLLTTVQNGGAYTDDQLTWNDLREFGIGILQLLVYMTTVIVFLQWFRRAYYNLNLRMDTQHDDSWAVGAWFVPIMCLFRPYQMTKEIDDGLDFHIEKRSSRPVPPNGMLIGVWWAFWIINGIAGNILFRKSLDAETVPQLLDSTMADMISFALDVPLAILAAFVIRKISEKETRLEALEQEDYQLKVA